MLNVQHSACSSLNCNGQKNLANGVGEGVKKEEETEEREADGESCASLFSGSLVYHFPAGRALVHGVLAMGKRFSK